jgi:hypothetical protein
LLYVLFTVLEMLLWSSVVGLWCIDPRGLSGFDNAAGIGFLFSLVGLSVVCWLLKGVAPRLASVGFVTILGGFLAGSLLPAVP